MNEVAFDLSRAIPLHRRIERTLRQRIESGELPSGQQLPSTSAMAEQMGVHPLTVQKALRRLKNDGLIDRTPRIGTFVRGPVHAPTIALLFGPNLALEHAHFHRAMMRALQTETSGRWTARLYDGLSDDAGQTTSAARKSNLVLKKDCEHLSFTGVIAVGFGYQPWEKIDALCRLPFAWMGVSSLKSDMAFDSAHFARTAVAHFASRKRRHVAYLRTFSPWSRGDREAFVAAAAELGIRRTEIHDIDDLWHPTFDEYVAYKRVIALVQEWRRTRWPDAVVVSDDIVMRFVALALLHCSEREARQVDLLTWANDRVRFEYGLPTARYEIPVAYCARRLKEFLDRRMDGKTLQDGPELVRGQIVECA